MRITCPFCGERDSREYSYLGDATLERPAIAQGPEAAFAHVYLRANPAGVHREHWHHSSGCRSLLVVTRNTLDHTIHTVDAVSGADPGAAA
jgi:methylglutamate dehydrogenase subunit B